MAEIDGTAQRRMKVAETISTLDPPVRRHGKARKQQRHERPARVPRSGIGGIGDRCQGWHSGDGARADAMPWRRLAASPPSRCARCGSGMKITMSLLSRWWKRNISTVPPPQGPERILDPTVPADFVDQRQRSWEQLLPGSAGQRPGLHAHGARRCTDKDSASFATLRQICRDGRSGARAKPSPPRPSRRWARAFRRANGSGTGRMGRHVAARQGLLERLGGQFMRIAG